MGSGKQRGPVGMALKMARHVDNQCFAANTGEAAGHTIFGVTSLSRRPAEQLGDAGNEELRQGLGDFRHNVSF